MTRDQGVKVKYVSEPVTTRVPQVNSLLGEELDRVPIVCEYPDVFLDELSGMPATATTDLPWYGARNPAATATPLGTSLANI